MKTGRRRADRVTVWLAATILCVLGDYAPAQGSGPADRETQESLPNNPLTGVIPASSSNRGTSSVLFVPVLLTASGQNNSFFTTELTLTNRSDREARVEYTYTADTGGGSGTATDVLVPGQQKIEPDALAYLRGLGIPIAGRGNRIGTLQVAVSESAEVGVTARTTTRVAEGRVGLAYPGVAAGFTDPVYLCGLRQNAQDRSNVAFQNMGTSAQGNITLKTTVLSGDPANPGSQSLREVVLAPGGFHQFNGILGKAGFDNGYVKVERVEGAAPFYAYGVINDQANSDGSFVFPVTETSLAGVRGQTLPVIIENPNFSSELMVTNFSSSNKVIDFGFVSDAIRREDRTARFSLTLAAGEQRIIPGIVEDLRRRGVNGLGPAGRTLAGAVFATARRGDLSGVVIGARTGSPGGGGQYSVFYNAVPYGAAFSHTAWVEALQQNEENRSNLALVNTGEVDGSDSVFDLEVYDGETGQQANTVTGIRVSPRGWYQINGILDRYVPGTSQGYLRVRKVAGNNPFLAYGVINDGGRPGQRSGDGAYLPAMERVHERQTEPMMTDREVLEALYEALGGPDWRDRSSWLSADPLGEWFGVGTDGAGRVTSLELRLNQLSGTIPPELGQLTRLQRLDLSGNQLSGTIPAALGNLANLEWLWLSDNQLSGAIPAELGNLANLGDLILSGNQLSGAIPAELGNLANLKALFLAGNQLSGTIPTALGNLANLEWLWLAGNQLSGTIPAELGNLANLEILDLSYNQFSGKIPQSLMQLSKIETLLIRGTQICVPVSLQAWLATLSEFRSSGLTCDGSLRVSFSTATYEVREGESIAVTVRLSDQTDGPARSVSVALAVEPGGGATGTDYSGVPDRITITAPAIAATFWVTAVKDSHYDHLETIVLGFRRPLPSGVTAGSPDTATVTIIDPGTEEMTDREVLEALYEALGGPDWRDRSNWLSADPLGEWFGVGTDGAGRVTSLELRGNGLSGSIPPALGQLAYLERLDLGHEWDSDLEQLVSNQLRGPIPPELGQLTRLQRLDLSGNQLSGTIPPALGNLANLEWLWLSENQLSGTIPIGLSNLANLGYLGLSGNQLSGAIPTELGNLANLGHLGLSGNQLSGAIPTGLGNLANLGHLGLRYNQLSGAIPTELGNLANLGHLGLSGNQLSGTIPTGLGNLANLGYLGLSGNQLSGTIPTELGNLANLGYLNLSGNGLSGAIPPELGNLANLWHLDLSYNQLSGAILPELGNLANLEYLNLSGNGLSGAIPPELGNLANLGYLGLSYNQLSGAIPPELGNLANLLQLWLSFNVDLTGTLPPGLQQRSLSTLDLMATSVCVPEDAEFQRWLKTIDLFLSSGVSCGRSPDAMSSIDVAVFFTPAARRIAGGNEEMEALIDLMVAETNQAYEDSGVNQRISLAVREEVNYEEENGNGAMALNRLAGASDGYMDEVHTIRDRMGADLVHLIADVTDVGGIAHLPGAFSVTCADGCGAGLFAHELGHNMGLSHDRTVDARGLLPYSHGYVNQQAFAPAAPESARWRTIMAYEYQCFESGGFGCEKIMRFSNPNQAYLGDPLGVPGEDRTSAATGPADAVRALNLARHSVAGLRPRTSENQRTISSTLSQARSVVKTSHLAPPPEVLGSHLFRAVVPNSRGAASKPAGGVSDQATLRRREVAVDIGSLASVPEGGRTALRLNLFDDVVLIGIIERRRPTYSGGFALSGQLAGLPEGRVTLVVNGSVVAGTVRIPGATYRIRPVGAGRHAIMRVDPSQFPQGCETVRWPPRLER